MRRSLHVLVAIAVLAGASCGGDDSNGGDGGRPVSTAPAVLRPDSSNNFGWTEFGSDDDDSGTVQTGSILVPYDYDDPSVGTFDLFVARHLATDPDHRIGSLLVNPGGPGFGGSEVAMGAAHYFSADLLAQFDIVGWDPRGDGQSTPAIDCIDDYDRYFASSDITPDDAGERQTVVDLAKELAGACVQHNSDIIDYIGTNNSARDMDTIRAALGEPRISYFGFSYGSELGATWMTLFPDTVRSAVLDGAVDPRADLEAGNISQTTGFESTFADFLAACSSDDDCAFHSDGDATGAFEALMKQADDRPIATEPGRPPVNLQMLVAAAAEAMYSDVSWPELEQALADARDGDGRGVMALYDEYYMRRPDGTYPNTLEAYQTIKCMDNADRPTVADEDALAARLQVLSPHLNPNSVGQYLCTFFPAAADPRIAITGAGAGPVLVVGTTGDPATPLAGSQAMANALEEGVMLTVVADQHTGYGANQCSFDVVDAYLIDQTVPPIGSRCDG